MVNPTDDVKVPDSGFMDNYDFGGEYIQPPQPKVLDEKGKPRYIKFVAQVPAETKIHLRDKATGKWLTTREGLLKAIIEGIKLVDGGYEFRETHVGTGNYKKYKNGQPTGESRNASPAVDYFHAHGIAPTSGDLKDAADYEKYFKATADRQFEVTGDWNAYDSETKSEVATKWEDFPMLLDAAGQPTGERQPFIEKDGKKFWARMNIKRYVSQVSKE
jgi:hypothetical protein